MIAPLLIAAAASLSGVLPEVGRAWTKTSGVKVEFTFDATSRLARQISEGAPLDALISADEEWMDALSKEGKIAPETRADLLTNRLVAVVPAKDGSALAGPRDLAAAGVKHLALAGEAVPAGKYARAALESTGLWSAVEPKVVRAEHVRAALRWVSSGEAEAGIVYATDAAGEPKVKVAFVFPATSHPPIVYPAAAVKNSAHAAQAAAFLTFCRGPEAIALFKAAGFGAAAPVRK